MTHRRNLLSILGLSALCVMLWSATIAASAVPTYTPIITEDYEGYNNGDPLHPTWSTRSFVDSSRPHSGAKSGVIKFKHTGQAYGFATSAYNLPQTAVEGDTIWYRVYLYIPATASFSGGDLGGHWGWVKFMVLSQRNHKNPRIYLDVPSPYKKNFGDAGFARSGLTVETDLPGGCNNFTSFTVPRNQWFSLQMAVKLSTTNGWVRSWADNTFLGECPTNIPSGYAIGHWGIGDWINGGGWVQGSSTDAFWIDDVVITKQTPNSVDSGGRPFIDPAHFTGNTQVIANPNPPTLIQ